MEGLAGLLPPLLPCAPRAPSLLGLARGALLAALRQAVERIARMREAAAACLQRLLPAAAAAGVPLADELSAAVCGRPLEQFSNLEALPALAALVAHPALQAPLLEGLTFSIGGLDSQLSTATGDALAAAVQERLGEDAAALEGLGGSLLALWRRQPRGGRLCTPLLLAADMLLSRTALGGLAPPSSTFPEQVGRGGVLLGYCSLPKPPALRHLAACPTHLPSLAHAQPSTLCLSPSPPTLFSSPPEILTSPP